MRCLDDTSPLSSSIDIVTVPNMGCQACTPMRHSRRPWHKFVSGSYSPDADGDHGRRAHAPVVPRSLPRATTDRIPQELVERIIDCLAWHSSSLYHCALVCRAWYHHSQTLLYSCVEIGSRAGYHTIADLVNKSPRTKQYLKYTRLLSITTAREDWSRSQAQRNYFPALPLVLGSALPNLQCLGFYDSLYPPYHSSFISLLPTFSGVIHLTLYRFEVCSFMDLRHIVCSFPKLRVLELMNGNVTSTRSSANITTARGKEIKSRRIGKLTLRDLESPLLSQLANWLLVTNACAGVTELALTCENAGDNRLSVEMILRALGPSLADLVCSVSHFRRGACTSHLSGA